jgi:hypothetical protein
MTRCLSSDQLSAHLDAETTAAEARIVESHLAACPDCRARRAALSRGALALQRLPRAAPPSYLAARVREQALAQAPEPGLRKLGSYLADLPFAFRSRTSLRLGFAALLVLALLGPAAVQWALPLRPLDPPPHVPHFKVDIALGDDSPLFSPPTKAEVAGRTFELSRDDVWEEKGLRATDAAMRVPAHSPVGRAILARYTDLDVLVADGGRVVIEDGLRTVELVGSL